ncbi:MupG family TIM beta-alpha barrel fold protein [Ignavigranum ruoffiae]|uniref:DUF871 domain-containing protein n=1 Tax=Ignavigranum ruoffiae TaxID=89093 RepID=UPI002060D9A5|nr:MupG family TIM beta-alpha barrel fold protein [Ignavigranum ruoffiae]UPQ86091.1 MupG family TIM beta-alpha barrel fold protein [Ignavigranum ruoffiae]
MLKPDSVRPQLGCSIYPDFHDFKEIENYIHRLHQRGVNRIFLSLLQIDAQDTKKVEKYKKLLKLLNTLSMTVVVDINPNVIKRFAWEENTLDHIHERGIQVIRLDVTDNMEEIVQWSHNDLNIKIEINMSTHEQLLVDLIEAGANLQNITASHNFYPRKLTGLSLDHFMYMTKFFKERGIETAAFVSSPHAVEGPWPLSEGLCTLEIHRNQSLATQIKFYKLLGLIDHVIVANQFMSEDELIIAEKILKEPIFFNIHAIQEISEVERQIIAYPHHYRGDISPYLIRSSEPRLVFQDKPILPINQSKRAKKGTILIDNDLYNRYKGELYIALQDIDLDQRTNVVGQIETEEVYLIDYLQAWQAFNLQIVD